MKITFKTTIAAWGCTVCLALPQLAKASEPIQHSAGTPFSLVRCPELAAPSRACRGEGSAVEPTQHSSGTPFSLVSAVEPTEMSACTLTLSYEQALQILGQAHAQYWYDHITLADLVQQYNDGVCTIAVTADGCLVKAGGGLGTVVIYGNM